ncbi:hypothetical protein B0H13DRAFT_2662245, partial [Mycena leptocephala]
MFQLNSTLLLYRALTTSDSDQAMWRVSPTDIARSVLALFSQLRWISRPAGLGRRPGHRPGIGLDSTAPPHLSAPPNQSLPQPTRRTKTKSSARERALAAQIPIHDGGFLPSLHLDARPPQTDRVIVLLRDAWRIQTGASTKRDAMVASTELFLDAVVVLPWCGSRAAALRRPPPSPSAEHIPPPNRAMRLDTVLPSGASIVYARERRCGTAARHWSYSRVYLRLLRGTTIAQGMPWCGRAHETGFAQLEDRRGWGGCRLALLRGRFNAGKRSRRSETRHDLPSERGVKRSPSFRVGCVLSP